ncbi:alpha/beta hydrolase [Nonomuraea sp. NPDC049607]|uniref:alpha/beta hydrolase n=1 Tax=Nonomuraea sp. NPDC049607 TaxID=3154732 RepID=UPI0034245BC4
MIPVVAAVTVLVPAAGGGVGQAMRVAEPERDTAELSVPAREAAALTWSECGNGLRCATLSVPADWARPRETRTTVELAMMPAQDPLRRLGALVVNTGSASVVREVRARPDTVGELARWFDVVLVEARGAGEQGTTGVCPRSQPDPARLRVAEGRTAWRAFARDNAAYDRSCRAALGPAYAGLTSWQVAHDLDAVRAALGESRLSYLGNGYGSVYGQAYLELFPGRAGRMYLEGLPDHTETGLERRLLAQARAQERQLGHFRDWCRTRPGCPLGHADAVRVFDALVRRAPLRPGGGERRVSRNEVAAAVWAGLTPARWPALAHALSAARTGDATGLAALIPAEQPERTPAAGAAVPGPPQAATQRQAPGTAAGEAVPGDVEGVRWCRDFGLAVPGYRRFLQVEARLRRAAPRVGWLSGRAEAARCLGAARSPGWPPHPVAAGLKVPPVLVGVGRLDNGTPSSGAARAAAQIPGARLLWHGDGQGAYLAQGVSRLRAACLRTKVHDYLVNGVLPKPGTFCPGELTAGDAP